MKIRQVVCDECRRKEDLKYNGEHWLIPTDWVEMYSDQQAQTLDIHLCNDCKPVSIKKPKKVKKGSYKTTA